MTKFKVGDKVVPISKTVDWNTLNRVKDHLGKSGAWDRALSNEQTFLYVNRIDKFRNLYICSNECGGGGDYFHETDLTPYKTKPTKNQRITALENEVAELRPLKQEVAELKLIVHELRGKKSIEPSTTNTVEDIIEFEGQQYRKVDREAKVGDVVIFNSKIYPHNAEPNKPYIVNREIAYGVGHHDGETMCNVKFAIYDHGRTPENVDVYELIEGGLNPQISIVDETIEPLTPNQQRAVIIEKAKKFVDENKSKYRSEWNIVGHTVQILIYDSNGMLMMFRQAKCNPSDVFNEHIGKAIALGRALGLDVSEFEQAVQPNEFVVGHFVKENRTNSYIKPFEISSIEKSSSGITKLVDEDETWIGGYECVIINDTNAKYEEG